MLGLAFKENCTDIRNTRVIDIVREFERYHARVEVYDPWVDAAEARQEYGLTLQNELVPASYDAIILAVAHRQFIETGAAAMRALGRTNHVLYDVKCLFGAEETDGRL